MVIHSLFAIHSKIEMIPDRHKMEWEIRTLREAIAQDWARLAANNLTLEQRRALRDHLDMSITALREMVSRNRLASQTAKIRGRSARYRSG